MPFLLLLLLLLFLFADSSRVPHAPGPLKNIQHVMLQVLLFVLFFFLLNLLLWPFCFCCCCCCCLQIALTSCTPPACLHSLQVLLFVFFSFFLNLLLLCPLCCCCCCCCYFCLQRSRRNPKWSSEWSAVDAYLKLSPKGDCSNGPHGHIGDCDVSSVTNMSDMFVDAICSCLSSHIHTYSS